MELNGLSTRHLNGMRGELIAWVDNSATQQNDGGRWNVLLENRRTVAILPEKLTRHGHVRRSRGGFRVIPEPVSNHRTVVLHGLRQHGQLNGLQGMVVQTSGSDNNERIRDNHRWHVQLQPSGRTVAVRQRNLWVVLPGDGRQRDDATLESHSDETSSAVAADASTAVAVPVAATATVEATATAVPLMAGIESPQRLCDAADDPNRSSYTSPIGGPDAALGTVFNSNGSRNTSDRDSDNQDESSLVNLSPPVATPLF